MGLPTHPVTLSVEQIEQLNKLLASMRHDINGDLALVVASAELIKLNPASVPRMVNTLMEQPSKIREKIDQFSAAFEQMMGITRP